MSLPLILALAMLLDACAGEPRWLWDHLPHPTVLMGRAVQWSDRTLNTGPYQRLKGVGAMLGLGLGAVVLGLVLQELGGILQVIIAAILLAQKSLVTHVRAVGNALRMSLGDGRRAVAMIVGRDTSAMQPPDVARAAIESAAENLSDGVIAPAFWFLVAGLPGLFLYKITNTADSMIGHRTPRHEAFGWAAARFDDLLNLIPARLTCVIIALPGGYGGSWAAIRDDAMQHRSPNAGWPEAAMARALNVALSGPRSYGGTKQEFPYVNAGGRRDIGADDIDTACRVLWRSWAVALAVVIAILVVQAVTHP